MPTGYTSGVADGTVTEFKDFVMACARAFGACIEMRDDPANKPIPDEFKPSTYHQEQLDLALKEKAKIVKWTASHWKKACEKHNKEMADGWKASEKERNIERKRYGRMIEAVASWVPPSEDHRELKNFMANQLTESMAFDCGSRDEYKPKKMSITDYRQMKINEVEKDIAYHTEGQREENERTEKRNLWIKQLRQSLTK